MRLLIFPILFLLFLCATLQAGPDSKESINPAIAKARAATGKTLIKCSETAKEGWEPLNAALAKLKKGGQLRLAMSGYEDEIVVKQDNVIIEGDPEGKPCESPLSLDLTGADGCILRGLCCSTITFNGELTLVDCYVGEFVYESEPGGIMKGDAFHDKGPRGVKRKSKGSIFAGNCVIRSCSFISKKDYEVPGKDADGRRVMEKVKVSGSFFDAEFSNCVLSGEELFKIDGNMSLSFDRSLLSSDKIFTQTGNQFERPGKTSFSFENNAIYFTSSSGLSSSDPANEYVKSLRRAYTGQVSSKGKLLILTENPFQFEEIGAFLKKKTEDKGAKKDEPPTKGKKDKKDKKDEPEAEDIRIENFLLKENSPATALGLGVTLGPNGFLGAPAADTSKDGKKR